LERISIGRVLVGFPFSYMSSCFYSIISSFLLVELGYWSQKPRVSFPFLWPGVWDTLSKADTAGWDVLMVVLGPLISNYVKPDVK